MLRGHSIKGKGVAWFLLTVLILAGIVLCHVMASSAVSVQATQSGAEEAFNS